MARRTHGKTTQSLQTGRGGGESFLSDAILLAQSPRRMCTSGPLRRGSPCCVRRRTGARRSRSAAGDTSRGHGTINDYWRTRNSDRSCRAFLEWLTRYSNAEGSERALLSAVELSIAIAVVDRIHVGCQAKSPRARIAALRMADARSLHRADRAIFARRDARCRPEPLAFLCGRQADGAAGRRGTRRCVRGSGSGM